MSRSRQRTAREGHPAGLCASSFDASAVRTAIGQVADRGQLVRAGYVHLPSRPRRLGGIIVWLVLGSVGLFVGLVVGRWWVAPLVLVGVAVATRLTATGVFNSTFGTEVALVLGVFAGGASAIGVALRRSLARVRPRGGGR